MHKNFVWLGPKIFQTSFKKFLSFAFINWRITKSSSNILIENVDSFGGYDHKKLSVEIIKMYLAFNVLDHPSSFNFISKLNKVQICEKYWHFFIIKYTFGEGKPDAWHFKDTVDPFFTTSSPDPGCLVSDGATERNTINEKKKFKKHRMPFYITKIHRVHLKDNCLLDCIYTSALILIAMRVLFLSELHLYCLCNKQ